MGILKLLGLTLNTIVKWNKMFFNYSSGLVSVQENFFDYLDVIRADSLNYVINL